jgi:putative membrane protein
MLVVFSIIVLSGTLGIFTLKLNYFFKSPLLVCVTGLFAFPMLIKSLFDKPSYIKQEKKITTIPNKNIFLTLFGSLSALLIILIPSFSSSQAAVIVSKIKQNLNKSEYLILFSSISISALIFSYFLAINFYKPRLGYIAILLLENQIPIQVNYLVFSVSLILSVSLSILLVYLVLDKIIDFVNTHNIHFLNIIALVISFTIVLLISGFNSIFLLLLSILIGFLPIQFNKSRVILMGYIMIPTLLFYI